MTTSPATTPANRLFSLPRPDWLDLHQEETLDPARPIIDAIIISRRSRMASATWSRIWPKTSPPAATM